MDNELAKLLKDIEENPDILDDFDETKLEEIRGKINPFRGIIPVEKEYANISILNWRETYLRQFMMTALVGFTYRQFKDYEANETDKEVIKKFLDSFLEFNVDEQVRSISEHNKNEGADPSRDLEKFRNKNAEVASSEPAGYGSLAFKDAVLSVYAYSRRFVELAESKSANTEKSIEEAKQMHNAMRPFVQQVAAEGVKSVYEVDPPVDSLYHFERYYSGHFEELREAVNQIYREKPDLEFAIQYIKSFKGANGEAEADEHRKMNESKLTTTITTIENNIWSLLGPFRENRDRVDFYNKNVEVIKKMLEKAEEDHKLGKDIMTKRVQKKKRKNIMEHGPDAEGLRAYKEASEAVASLGTKETLSDDDKKKYEEAYKKQQYLKEQLEVPEGAIQTDIFHVDSDGKMQRKIMYTEAEAPEYLNDKNYTTVPQTHNPNRASKTIESKNAEPENNII